MENYYYQKNIYWAHLSNLITFIISLVGDIVLFAYGIVASCLAHAGLIFAMYSLPALLGLPTLFFIHYYLEAKIDQVEAQENHFLICQIRANREKMKNEKELENNSK